MHQSYKKVLEELTPYLQQELTIDASFLACAIKERLILLSDSEEIEVSNFLLQKNVSIYFK